MDFIDRLRVLSAQFQKQLEHIKTEEATKTALIMPFLNALGYNVFDPTEVTPEFNADIGTKKGEKVDYAILRNGKPTILIECKWSGTTLDKEQASQLYRYFSVTEAKFGILTNGLVYKFFSDLDETNKMDQKAFFEFNILDIKEASVEELKKFTKDSFDLDANISAASELKYTNEIKRFLAEQLINPDPDFVYLLTSKVYSSKITQSVRERFLDLVKKAFTQFINDKINDRLKSAMDQIPPKETEQTATPENKANNDPENNAKKQIETTEEEVEAFHIVKSILREVVDLNRVAMRDTQSYCGILLDDNNRKPICRFYFGPNSKFLAIIKEDKTEEKVKIEALNDIYSYSAKLKETIAAYQKQLSQAIGQ